MSKERRLYPRYTLTTNLHILITPIGLAPRGCKVVDYSRGGILLESQARPDELPIPLDVDLSRGETAEVSLVDPTAPDRPQFNLSGQIVRVSETHVAVYFLNASQETIDRLEKVVMRHVEQKPKIEAGPDRLRSEVMEARKRVPVTPPANLRNPIELGRWLVPAASVAALLLLAAIFFYVSELENRIDSLEDTLVASVQSRGDGTVLRDVRNELGVLGARVDEVGNGIDEVKQRVEAVEARPAEVGAGPKALSMQQKQLDAVSDLVGKLEARLETVEQRKPAPVQAPMRRKPTPAAAPPEPTAGPWVVHLMSSVDPTVIATMKSKAEALGMKPSEEVVSVRGRRITRLSVPGFASRPEAEAFADQAMAKLGLPDKPWVARN